MGKKSPEGPTDAKMGHRMGVERKEFGTCSVADCGGRIIKAMIAHDMKARGPVRDICEKCGTIAP